jgi:SNF2 family DNA or RNA helicase
LNNSLGVDSNPAHEEALAQLKANHGLIAAHSTGSGKTLLSLRAAQQAGGDSLFITPASLVGNVHKEIKKHKVKGINPEVVSYEKATRDYDRLAKKHFNLVVMDEAHRLRNGDTDSSQKLSDLASRADNRLLLTATPIYNSPKDLNRLVNIAAGKKVVPEDDKTYNREFIKKETIHPKVMDRLLHGARTYEVDSTEVPEKYKPVLEKYVHQYDATTEKPDDFPTTSEKDIKVEMSHKQKAIYDYYEGKLPPALKWKVRMGLPVDRQDAARLNVFSSSMRQASNGTEAFSKHPEREHLSPKLREAVDRLHKRYETDPNFRGLVYSNYLKAGIEPYSRELTKRGISHQILTGSVSKPERDEIVKNYNTGKHKVLLVSSAGTEGLDLKGTKLVQTLEPHFNDAKIHQVKGRAARYKSHAHLPQEERHVDFENYISVRKHGGRTIDEHLNEMSKIKKREGEDILDSIS